MNQSAINPNRLTSEKYYPISKVVSMVLAFIAAAFMLYFAAESAKGYMDTIKELNAQIQEIKLYEAQGAEIPAEYKAQFNLPIAYYTVMILNFVFAILPIIGALLPKRYSKISLLLISAPIAFCFHNILLTIAYSLMKVEIKMILSDLLLNIAGILLIASAISLIIEKKKEIEYEDEADSPFGYSYIPEDLEDEDYSNFAPLEASDESGEVEIEITVEEELDDSQEEAEEETIEEIKE